MRVMTISRPAELGAALIAPYKGALSAGAPLSVGDGDTAVAVQHGQVLGIYGPGQFNLPGQVPPDVKLYFVLSRPLQGVKFGGRLPGFPPVPGGPPPPTMVFGECAVRVSHPGQLLIQLLGYGEPDAEAILSWAKAQLLQSCSDVIARMIVKDKKNPADAAELFALIEAVTAGTKNWAEYGLELAEIATITLR